MKKAIFTIIRAAIGIGLAVFLIRLTLRGANMDIVQLWEEHLREALLPLLFVCLILHGVALGIGSLRWRVLMTAQHIDISYLTTLRLALIGFFFNLAVPGAVGGDVVKVGYTMRRAPNKKTAAAFSIVVDRIMGILGLFIVAGVAVLFNLPTISRLGETSSFLQMGAILVGLGSVAGIFGFLALEYHARLVKHPRLQPLWDFCSRKLPHKITETVLRLMHALDLYRRSKLALGKALLLSVCVHCTLALNMFLIGQALKEDQLHIGEYFLTTQIANAVAAVPLTPGGLGLRDKGAQEFFAALGMAEAKSGAIPVTLTMIILTWAVIGGIVFTIAPIHPHLPEEEDEE